MEKTSSEKLFRRLIIAVGVVIFIETPIFMGWSISAAIHELGHYLTCLVFGVKAYIRFPPRCELEKASLPNSIVSRGFFYICISLTGIIAQMVLYIIFTMLYFRILYRLKLEESALPRRYLRVTAFLFLSTFGNNMIPSEIHHFGIEGMNDGMVLLYGFMLATKINLFMIPKLIDKYTGGLICPIFKVVFITMAIIEMAEPKPFIKTIGKYEKQYLVKMMQFLKRRPPNHS